ncbi:hypothetical protein BGZ75_000278, partial [Mortierella antarctica]
LSKDTNAQESIGGDFQRKAPRKKLSIMEILDHEYRYSHTIETDYGMTLKGMKLRYDERKRKTRTFVMRTTRTSVGRPKGSKNTVPKLGSDVYGIPLESDGAR